MGASSDLTVPGSTDTIMATTGDKISLYDGDRRHDHPGQVLPPLPASGTGFTIKGTGDSYWRVSTTH